jgi:hypothetical protein
VDLGSADLLNLSGQYTFGETNKISRLKISGCVLLVRSLLLSFGVKWQQAQAPGLWPEWCRLSGQDPDYWPASYKQQAASNKRQATSSLTGEEYRFI